MSEQHIAEETHNFGTEVGRLLDLVVHSLYSDREIFLRELVANAADATDKRRFLALSDESLALPENPSIRISLDKLAQTITIADHGTGMSKEELAENLGTIARSGTAAFTSTLAAQKPEDRPSLIGQFGVGFYSAFMVADEVEVISRKAGAADAWAWVSAGKGVYTLKPATREEAGTTIILHVKPDAEEYLEPLRIKTVIRKWADHIALPVELEEDGKFAAVTEGTALWRRSPHRITRAFTAISAICSTNPGRRSIGARKARWNFRRCCSSPPPNPSCRWRRPRNPRSVCM